MAEKKHALGDQGITINVDDYVDHFYIHYKTQTAKHLAGYAQSLFDQKRIEAINKARGAVTDDQLNAMLATMNSQVPSAASVAKIIKSIDEGNLLEQTLNQIAESMNEAITREYGNNYADTISSVQASFNTSLVNGGMGAQAAAEFFNQIEQAMALIGEHMNDAELGSFKALQQVFADGSGWSEDLVAVSEQSVTIASRIIKTLNNAAQKLSAGGMVSRESFSSTITQIFSTMIGEELARQMIQTALWDIQQQADAAIVNTLSKLDGKVEWADVRQAGTDRFGEKGQKRTAKVDIITSNVFSLSASLNGMTADIEIGANASVKWQQKKSRSIHLVGGTPITTAFSNMGIDSNGLQAAYNVIAHRFSPNYPSGSTTSRGGNLYQAYNSIRASVAGSFFTEWLTGSGSPLGHGGIDRAQFLMYNGRIYSVMSIINKICEGLLAGKRSVNAEIRGINKIDNSFIGYKVNSEEMDVELANERSELVRGVINSLTIAGSLNTNILKGL